MLVMVGDMTTSEPYFIGFPLFLFNGGIVEGPPSAGVGAAAVTIEIEEEEESRGLIHQIRIIQSKLLRWLW